MIELLKIATVTLGLGAGLSLVTPKLGYLTGAVDVPSPRKIHLRPVPRLGGFGIVAALLIGSSIAKQAGLMQDAMDFVVLGVGLTAVIGIADDIWGLSPEVKLLGILLCSLPIPWALGASGWGAAYAVFVLVATSNAANLLDGMDGLLAGCTAIIGAAQCVLGITSGLEEVAIFGALIAASALSFLPSNLCRPKQFMGDCGSLALGYALGANVLLLQNATHTPIQWVSPLVMLLPLILDTSFVILLRLRDGRGIFHSDICHSYNLLADKLGSKGQATLLFWLLCGLFALAGALMTLRVEATALAALGVISFLGITGSFERFVKGRRSGEVVRL